MKPPTRAWRFSFPPRDGRGAAPEAGLALSARGGIDLVTEADAVRQAILLLLSTRPGERVMRPDYGCHLFRLAFAPNDDTTAGLAIHYVRVALARWEPRIAVLHIDATRNARDASRLDIHLQYRLRSHPAVVPLALGYDLSSGSLH